MLMDQMHSSFSVSQKHLQPIEKPLPDRVAVDARIANSIVGKLVWFRGAATLV